MESREIGEIIEGFRRYLETEEGKSHLAWLKEREPKEVKEVLEKLRALPKDSIEFVDLVLYGLLPYGDTKYAKRVSIAPAFLNIGKFFARFNYTKKDWKELAHLIHELIVKFQENPDNLEQAITDFISSRLSKGLQCGSLSPIFCALNSDFPMVNNRVIRTYGRLSFLAFRETDKLSQKLGNYLSNVDKIRKFAKALNVKYGFKEITDMGFFDLFCYWYDSKVLKKERGDKKRSQEEFREAKSKEINLPSFIETIDLKNPSKFSPHLLRNPERIKITQIISNCSSTNWVLPHFQRYFDWKTQDVNDFLKSIFNDYYVGAFLLWDAGREPEVKVQAIKGVGRSKDLKSDSVILDGQQRITSLFYAINAPNLEGFADKSNWRDTRIYREHPLYFYINFGTFLKDPKSPDVIEVHKMKIGREDCFKFILFPLYELEKYDEWISKFEKFLRDYSDNHDKIYEIKEIIRKKLSHMWAGYEIPYILLPKEMKIDQVTEIFEQLNTKGKPLSVFDLLIARLYKYDIKLKDLWDSTTRKYPNIFRFSKYIEKTPIYILQAISLFYDKNSSAKRSDILDIHKNVYEKTEYRFEDHWVEFSEYLDLALKKLENLRDGFGVKDEKSVPFAPMIPVLAALLKLVETQRNQADCYKKIVKWYWSSVFTNSYSKAAGTQMTTDFKEMRDWFKDDSKTPKTISRMIDDFPKLSFLEIQSKSHSQYRGVMSLIALEGAKDFDTNLTLENARKNDKDHLFPRSGANKLGFGTSKNINSVLNMTWMSDNTNRRIKKAKNPSIYLKDLVSKRYGGKKDDLLKILRTHLISREAFDYLFDDKFTQFLLERERTILSKIKEHLEIEDVKLEWTLITPETPYTNRRIFWNAIRLCNDHIHWVDKYFSKAGLELLSESLNSEKIREIKVLMSLEKANESFRRLFKDFRDELENKGINCELRVIIDSKTKSKIHDRWIISKNRCFNVTSPDVMARGQYSEIKETTNRPPFNQWWKNSKDIVKDWNEIKNILANSVPSKKMA